MTVWKIQSSTCPHTIAYETVSSVENLFVLLETDNGITGIEAGSPAEDVTGETIWAGEKALADNLDTVLQGRDVRYYRSMLQELDKVLANTRSSAAVDIALHDLVAKAIGLPSLINPCPLLLPLESSLFKRPWRKLANTWPGDFLS